MYQGGWDNTNNPSTYNGINIDTGALEIAIYAEYGQIPVTLINKINNESSVGANKINN